jgi:GGDEF domain-containing protein
MLDARRHPRFNPALTGVLRTVSEALARTLRQRDAIGRIEARSSPPFTLRDAMQSILDAQHIADQAMYLAKREGRNRVSTIPQSDPATA